MSKSGDAILVSTSASSLSEAAWSAAKTASDRSKTTLIMYLARCRLGAPMASPGFFFRLPYLPISEKTNSSPTGRRSVPVVPAAPVSTTVKSPFFSTSSICWLST